MCYTISFINQIIQSYCANAVSMLSSLSDVSPSTYIIIIYFIYFCYFDMIKKILNIKILVNGNGIDHNNINSNGHDIEQRKF